MKHSELALIPLAAALMAGGCDSESKDACPGGDSVTTSQAQVCVYDARALAIIENGFRCPPDRPIRNDARDPGGELIVICSADEDVDVEEVQRVRENPEQAADAPPGAAEDDGRDRGDPPDDPPPAGPLGPLAEGEACNPFLVACEAEGAGCRPCADGLACVAVNGDAERGRCMPPGDGERGDACDPEVANSCNEGLGCGGAVEGGAPFCTDACLYTNFECDFGFVCPDGGGLCTVADPAPELPGNCRPGRDECVPGQGCFARTTRDRYEGFFCDPAGRVGPFGRCNLPTDCQDGLACVVHLGWSGSTVPANAIFDLVWTGPEPHPYAGRSAFECRPLCGPGLPDCGDGQACVRIERPAPFAADPPLPDGYFAFLGVCNRL